MSRFQYTQIGKQTAPLMAYCLDESGRDVPVLGPATDSHAISTVLSDPRTLQALGRVPTLNLRSLQLRVAKHGDAGVYNRLLPEAYQSLLSTTREATGASLVKANYTRNGRETVLQGRLEAIALVVVSNYGFTPETVDISQKSALWRNRDDSQALRIDHMTESDARIFTQALNRAVEKSHAIERSVAVSAEPTLSPPSR